MSQLSFLLYLTGPLGHRRECHCQKYHRTQQVADPSKIVLLGVLDHLWHFYKMDVWCYCSSSGQLDKQPEQELVKVWTHKEMDQTLQAVGHLLPVQKSPHLSLPSLFLILSVLFWIKLSKTKSLPMCLQCPLGGLNLFRIPTYCCKINNK